MRVRARCAPHFSRVVRQRPGMPDGGGYPMGCLAGTHYCRVTCDGEVTPCPYLPLPAGNLRRETLDAVWGTSLLLRDLRTQRATGKCGRCDFGEYCRGCRARAYATRGALWEEDPWCLYQPPASAMLSATPSQAVRPVWTVEAKRCMERAPAFVRPMVSSLVEQHARREGIKFITVELLEEIRGWRQKRRVPPQTKGASVVSQ